MPCRPDQGENCFAVGTVRRISARESGAFIWLNIIDPDGDELGDNQGPEDDTPGGEKYFELRRGHPNYNALYSLVLVAATNRRNLTMRTEDPIDPGSSGNAVVRYLNVDW